MASNAGAPKKPGPKKDENLKAFESALAEGAKDEVRAAQKKAGKKKTKKPPRLVRIWRQLWGMVVGTGEMFLSLWSYDRLTRHMALGFFMAIMGIGALTLVGGKYFRRWDEPAKENFADAQARNLSRFIAKQKGAHEKFMATTSLGSFLVQLKKPEGRIPAHVLNMAEIEVALVCDSQATCDAVDSEKIQLRDQITRIFLEMSREDLMSLDGKRTLKEEVLRRLNAWIKKGEVRDVYFTKLIIS